MLLLALPDSTNIWQTSGVDTVAFCLQHVGSRRHDNDQLNAFRRRIPPYSTIGAKYTRTLDNIDLSASGTNLDIRGYFSYGITGAGSASNVHPERCRALFMSVAAGF